MNISISQLVPVAVIIIVPLVISTLLKTAAVEAAFRDGKHWVEYSRVFKRLALLGMLPVPLLLCAWFFVAPGDQAPLVWLAGIFAVLDGLLLIEFVGVRIGFDDEKIYCFSGWRKRRVIPWTELTSCSFSEAAKWWVIETRNAGKIRIHEFTSGRETFFATMGKITGIGPNSQACLRLN